MKKGLFIACVTLCFSGLMMAQEVEQAEEQEELKGVHPYKTEQNEKGIKPEIAHWSIIPHFGFSAFDGDFTSEMKHCVAVPSVGLAVEYNFTPNWNIGVEYMYDMYTVTGASGHADTLLTGHMHKAGAYLSMDLINLFFPRAKRKIVSILPYVGGGAAWYKRAKYYMDDRWYDAEKGKVFNETHGRGNTLNYINADGEVGPDRDHSYRTIGYVQAGVNVEFNLNRTLALGVRANYSYFTRDYVDGRGYHKQSVSSYASKNNDGIFDVTLNMRFKLEAVKKSHPRNMPSFSEFDKLLAQQEQPKAAEVTPHDTVIIRHDSIIVREIIRETHKKDPRIYNVYFDNDKDFLRQDAQSTIQEACMAMEDDPTLYAVVVGYCDNTGSKAHNYDLGDRRAKNVFEEMAEEYDIPADHMFNAGVGKIAARKAPRSFGPNRRVSIHLVDKETFELMKLQLQDKSSDRNMDESQPVTYDKANTIRVPKLEQLEEQQSDDQQTVPLSESSQKKDNLLEQYKERNHETYVVEKGMTLSRLARQYYNNSQCWVFIYMANKDILATPTSLQEGQEIIIPELTQEELKVEPKEVLRLYSITAHRKLMENKK